MQLTSLSLALTRAGFLTFSPSSLFTAGEQGVWYDPSDTATLFQDSAGTTPVTAVEQPVGLMLDKSKGLVLGGERVTNGTFDTNLTGWTLGTDAAQVIATWTASGVSITRGTGGNAGFQQDMSLTVGAWYSVKFTLVSGANVAFGLAFSGATASGAGEKTYIFQATGTTLRFWPAALSSTAVIDNISVRELPGNHAFQATSTSRPVLSARYNLLTKTEQFDDAAWNKTLSGTASAPSVTANAATAPDGTTTADRVQLSLNGGTTATDRALVNQSVTYTSGATYTFSIWFRSRGSSVSMGIGADGIVGNQPITVTSAWQRFSFTAAAVSGSGTVWFQLRGGQSPAHSNSADIEVWGADLRVSNDAAGQPAYQRVNTATDYDTTGFKPYLRFDGTDDWLQTNSIDFTSTDKMTVFAGVRKLSDAATGVVAELSTTSSTTNGSFGLFAPAGAASNFSFQSRGSVTVGATATSFAAPITNVVTGTADISGDSVILRVNGTQAASSTADQGTGNYGNYPLYIGRRGGTTLPFNGRIYGLVIRGAASTTSQIQQTEAWLNQRTGAF
jgi:hypothetical protein